jgi:hypothetical protein
VLRVAYRVPGFVPSLILSCYFGRNSKKLKKIGCFLRFPLLANNFSLFFSPVTQIPVDVAAPISQPSVRGRDEAVYEMKAFSLMIHGFFTL